MTHYAKLTGNSDRLVLIQRMKKNKTKKKLKKKLKKNENKQANTQASMSRMIHSQMSLNHTNEKDETIQFIMWNEPTNQPSN